jgi:predicted lipid-binding transport protein (Tim44 family)
MTLDPSIIFFFALAAFLSYRLFSVLGTKGGHEPGEKERPVVAPASEGRAGAEAAEAPEPRKEPAKPLPAWALTVREHDQDFDPRAFTEGAKAAYEMIVTAFASGDLGDVRPYVDRDIMEAFEAAVAERRAAGRAQETSFVGIERAEVVEAERVGDRLELTVDYSSDQIRVTRDANGEVVEGDPNRIDQVRDRWTYARPVGSRDPNWTLIATDAA